MEAVMTLEQKAFLIMFAGVAMFFLFTMLPVMYFMDEHILKLHDTAWFVQFAVALVFISVFVAGITIFMMDDDKDKRLMQLKLAIHNGKRFVLYWNPVGWFIWFEWKVFAFWSLTSLVSHQLRPPDEEVPEK